MNPLLAYFLGALTPVLIFFGIASFVVIGDVLARRRYVKAVLKYTSEWNAMTPAQQLIFGRSKGSCPRSFVCERDRFVWVRLHA